MHALVAISKRSSYLYGMLMYQVKAEDLHTCCYWIKKKQTWAFDLGNSLGMCIYNELAQFTVCPLIYVLWIDLDLMLILFTIFGLVEIKCFE